MTMSHIINFLTIASLYSLLTILTFIVIQPIFFRYFKKIGMKQEIREDGIDGKSATLFKKLHAKKKGTPTGGGVIICTSVIITILISRFLSMITVIDKSILQRTEVYLPLFTLFVMCALGYVDDYINTRKLNKQKGLGATTKMIFLTSFSLVGAFWFYFKLEYTEVTIPFFGTYNFGIFAAILYVFIILAVSNSVNITDGLDGLAGGLLVQAYLVFGILSFARGHEFLSIFCFIISASLFVFLWFNIPPAKFFMGDSGSLSLGATLGVIAMMIDAVFVLPIICFLFLLETISVIIQIFSKKFRNGKKVFHIAPLHHHLEYIGWTESQIVMRFWIIGSFFSIIGLIIGLLNIVK